MHKSSTISVKHMGISTCQSNSNVLPTNARMSALLTCVRVIHTDYCEYSQLGVCVLMHTAHTYTGSRMEEKKDKRATWHQNLALSQYFSTTLITIYTLECAQENITTPWLAQMQFQLIWKDRNEQSEFGLCPTF